MKENEHKEAKSFGYRMGQLLAVVTVLCLISLMVAITVAIIYRIF